MALQTLNGKSIEVETNKEKVHFSYSTSEQWTGDYWIDGKKIYTKTIKSDGGDKPYPDGLKIFADLSNANEIIEYKGTTYADSDNRVFNLPFADESDGNTIVHLYENNTGYFALYTKKRRINKFWITVFYTKKND